MNRINLHISRLKNSDFLRSSMLIVVLRGASIAFNYVFILLLSKFYGALYVGYFALGFTLIQLFGIIARSGLDLGMFKLIASKENSEEFISSQYLRSVIYSTLLSIFLLFVYWVVDSYFPTGFFDSKELSSNVWLILLALPFYNLMFLNGDLHRGRANFGRFIVFQNMAIYVLLFIGISAYIFFEVKGFLPIAVLFFISSVVLFIASFKDMLFTSKVQRPIVDYKVFQPLLSTSIPNGLAALSFFMISWFDSIVIGQFYPEEVVGTYAVAYRIALIGSFALLATNSVIGPKVSELFAKGDLKGLEYEGRKASKLGFWMTFPFLIGIVLFPKFILGIFGEEFESPELVIIMLILIGGQLIATICGPSGFVLQLTGKQKIFKNIMIAVAALNVVMNYALVPNYALYGAAITNVVCVIIWNLSSSYMIHKTMGINIFYIPGLKKLIKY